MSVSLSVSPQYVAYSASTQITLTASGSFATGYTQYSYYYEIKSNDGGVVGAGQDLKTVKFALSDVLTAADYNNGVREIKFYVRGYRSDGSGEVWPYPSNTVTLYVTQPLSIPTIQSITPKSPKITETLRLTWVPVTYADSYTVTVSWCSNNAATWDNVTFYSNKTVRDNISAAAFSGDPYIDTCPAQYTDGQYGYLWYNVTAKSNDPKYTSRTSEYYVVNLNLASNLRYKSTGGWIRGKPYIKVGGAWNRAVKTYVKTNGVWKNA